MPANDSFEALFLPQSLATAVRRFAAEVEDPYLAEFEAGERLEPPGDAVHWDEVRFTRDLAPMVPPDSPSHARPSMKRTVRSGVLVDVKTHVDLSAREIAAMRAAGADSPRPAEKISDELANLTRSIMATKRYLAAQALVAGSVDLSAVPNSQLTGTLSYPIATASAAAAWSTTTTKIRSQEIPTMRQTYSRKAGLKADRALALKSVEEYLIANDEVSNYGANSLGGAILTSAFADGSAPRFGGLTWFFADPHYALDSAPDTEVDSLSGANADKIVVLPEASARRDVFAIAEGLTYVPASVPRFGDASPAGAAGMFQAERGFYAYAEQLANPVGVRLYAGWKGLLIVKLVNGVLSFDTTP